MLLLLENIVPNETSQSYNVIYGIILVMEMCEIANSIQYKLDDRFLGAVTWVGKEIGERLIMTFMFLLEC